MARNGSGSYSIVNTFVAGNTITATGHNQNMADIATELTNSVAADGQTVMSGPLKAANGTVAAPSYTFGSDQDSGWYRIGGNNIGCAVNGAKVLDVATTGLAVTGIFSATTSIDAPVIKQNGFAAFLVGEIKIWPGSSIPSGFLACQGQSLLRASYPDLFTAIGTTYGSADGTHFTLPDLGGRAVFGKEASATRLTTAGGGLDGGTLAAVGGAQNVTLLTANLPAYTPAGSVSVTPVAGTNGTALIVSSGGGSNGYTAGANVSANLFGGPGGYTFSNTFTGTAQGGTSTAVKTVPPGIILNYIIFAGV